MKEKKFSKKYKIPVVAAVLTILCLYGLYSHKAPSGALLTKAVPGQPHREAVMFSENRISGKMTRSQIPESSSDADADAGQSPDSTVGQLYARSAVLMDGTSGRILYGKNEKEVLPMASTTKIMTCILALENSDMEDVATVSDYAASMPEVSLDLKSGQKCKIRDLLYSIMLESHNDSAVVIAEHVAGSVEAFAAMMNAKAREIGCTDTFFVTPNGLDGEAADESGQMRSHSTTASDLALILRYCMCLSSEKETFREITTTPTWQFHDVDGQFSASLYNHNSFLTMMNGASSGKTGFTGKAGYCYVGSVIDDDRILIGAVLASGWPNNKTYKWRDMEKLIAYGRNYFSVQTVDTQIPLADVPVYSAAGDTAYLHAPVSLSVAIDQTAFDTPLQLLLADHEKIDVSYNIVSRSDAPVEQGQLAGTVIFSLNGTPLREYPVIFTESAEKITPRWCLSVIAEKFLNP